MIKSFNALCGLVATLLLSCSCAALSVGLAATGLAVSAVSLAGSSALLGYDLHTFVGSHKTAYEFEMVSVENDGHIDGAEIVHPKADAEYKAEYRDEMLNVTFCYSMNCFRLGMRNRGDTYLAINWNDVVMDSSQKLLWKDATAGLSTITPAVFNEAYLYVVYDTVSATHRTLPLFVSQKKADAAGLVGKEFTLTAPVIKGDKVITYSVRMRITGVNVN